MLGIFDLVEQEARECFFVRLFLSLGFPNGSEIAQEYYNILSRCVAYYTQSRTRPRVFFKRCNLPIILLVYMCKGYAYLSGFMQGRGTVWKISPVKTKDCDRPTRTPLVS